jgi:DNA-binding MarR family transcriptional regulator
MVNLAVPAVCQGQESRPNCQPTHPAVVAWLGLERLAARTERLLGAALRRHGLNHGQLALLIIIGGAEGLTQQDLADRVGLTKANVSQLLDRLEAARLVRRVPVGRAYALHLTEQSWDLLAKVIPEQEQLIVAQFANLSPQEQEQFQALVSRLGCQPDQALPVHVT